MKMNQLVHFLLIDKFKLYETIEIIGYKRANLGKNSNKLREEGNVPW